MPQNDLENSSEVGTAYFENLSVWEHLKSHGLRYWLRCFDGPAQDIRGTGG
jgi:hypothetical protein